VGIEDGATAKRHAFDRKILFIGDSITQGWNSVYDTMSYAYQTSEKLNADSIIQGTGGAMYNVKTFDKVECFNPDIVIIAYGTNDSNHVNTLEELGNNCREYLVQVKKAYVDSERKRHDVSKRGKKCDRDKSSHTESVFFLHKKILH
jgi:lysophospholipase L1-like esterase